MMKIMIVMCIDVMMRIMVMIVTLMKMNMDPTTFLLI